MMRTSPLALGALRFAPAGQPQAPGEVVTTCGVVRWIEPAYDPAAAVARILKAHGVDLDPHDYVAELAELLDSASARLRFSPPSLR